jgi:hypothetical protein
VEGCASAGGVGGAQRVDGLEAPLIGRDAELRTIRELFHPAAERTTRTGLTGLVVAWCPGAPGAVFTDAVVESAGD